MNSTISNKRRGGARRLRKLRFLSALHKANRQCSVHLEDQLADLGVSSHEGHLLTYVAVYGPCPVGELVRVFGLKKPTMTSMLDRLVARKLVTRKPHPDDRRSWLVGITPRGARVGHETHARVEHFERNIAKHVRSSDLRGFERVIEAIGRATGIVLRSERVQGS